jgi:pimeloyl-ACP methyl ester carboxylesterase
VDGPFTYSAMADDTVAYLDTVVGTKSHVIGWSDGAVVGLLVAQRRPDLVDRLVLIGQYYNSAGKIADSLLDQFLESEQAMGFLRSEYDVVSPDGPEHFATVFAKTIEMIKTEPEIELHTLADVAAPTLVLQGDRDEVRIDHTMAVAAAVRDGRFAVLPGTHALPIESPDVVNALLMSFLSGSSVPAWSFLEEES